jgi:chromate transporter
MQVETLAKLVVVFVPLSLAAFGGTPTVFAGIQHQAVDVNHWLTGREFVEVFAVARGAPGPGSMLITLIGWKAAGWLGAITATLALYVPASILTLVVAKVWNRYRGRPWHTYVQAGLAPIAVGLILAGVLAISRVAGVGALAWSVAAATAVTMGLRPNLNPLFLLTGGAAVFIAVQAMSME